MKSSLAFTFAAACLGAALACVQVGVAAMIAERAEPWERVLSDENLVIPEHNLHGASPSGE